MSAIQIVTPCGSGSGVLVNGNEALTALHVVECTFKTGGKQLAPMLLVTTWDEYSFTAITMATDRRRDLARIRLASNVRFELERATLAHPISVTSYAPSAPCFSAAVPERDRQCGHIIRLNADKPDLFIETEAKVWFGNSGSGLYNARGNLVGVITSLRWCNRMDEVMYELTGAEPHIKCGGYAASPIGSVVVPNETPVVP